ncbi:hypothetical protein GTQ34_14550 [Muricauda sp. JGD-17]|uniref:DUF5050 domain-containing protein n=1 Tax=Flagellimonas ochracea TaxID=2696472 RepID=A0A964TDX1_9FLAO|nr:PD40 domain-containing protein [Allomuricauda ochracea]NAY93133.1 hypothetical protein [Allomuricauda ochracea]
MRNFLLIWVLCSLTNYGCLFGQKGNFFQLGGVWEFKSTDGKKLEFNLSILKLDDEFRGRFESYSLGNTSVQITNIGNDSLIFFGILGSDYKIHGEFNRVSDDVVEGTFTTNGSHQNFSGIKISKSVTKLIIESSPNWSTPASALILTREELGNKDLIKYSKKEGEINLTNSKTVDEEGAVWSNKGSQIAFFSNASGNKEVYIMNPDGKQKRQITHGANSPDLLNWSFDDKYLMYSSPEGPFIIHVSTGMAQKYSVNQPKSYYARFSPNNYDISLTTTEGKQYDIAYIDFKTKHLSIIDSVQTPDFNQSISPNGKEIIWVSLRDGNSEIYKMNIKTKDLIRLTKNTFRDNNPVWSPLGDKIAWVARPEDKPTVYVMDRTGGKKVNVAKSNASDNNPVWGPDGNTIFFESDRTGEARIYALVLDKSTLYSVSDFFSK